MDVENIIFAKMVLVLLREVWKRLAKGTHAFKQINDDYVSNLIAIVVENVDREELFQLIKTELLSKYEHEKCHSIRYMMFVSNNTIDFSNWYIMNSTKYTLVKHLKHIYDDYLSYLLLLLNEVTDDCEECDESEIGEGEGDDDNYI
jgi:hypothetical protein